MQAVRQSIKGIDDITTEVGTPPSSEHRQLTAAWISSSDGTVLPADSLSQMGHALPTDFNPADSIPGTRNDVVDRAARDIEIDASASIPESERSFTVTRVATCVWVVPD
jgi:hypothetical protein